MQQGYLCPKCAGTAFESSEMRATGGFFTAKINSINQFGGGHIENHRMFRRFKYLGL